MTDHQRVCQRAGCQQSATVTLSFRYDARQASLVDLSAEAVQRRKAPGKPLLRGWGDLGAAREIGTRTGISWLQDDTLADEYGSLLQIGERTRTRLGV